MIVLEPNSNHRTSFLVPIERQTIAISSFATHKGPAATLHGHCCCTACFANGFDNVPSGEQFTETSACKWIIFPWYLDRTHWALLKKPLFKSEDIFKWSVLFRHLSKPINVNSLNCGTIAVTYSLHCCSHSSTITYLKYICIIVSLFSENIFGWKVPS